jgi:hypothetical protein
VSGWIRQGRAMSDIRQGRPVLVNKKGKLVNSPGSSSQRDGRIKGDGAGGSNLGQN